jgi:hypothetical protein
MLKRQFHETLSFIHAVYDEKFLKEFIKKTKLHMTFGDKKVMKESTFDDWVQEWERTYLNG